MAPGYRGGMVVGAMRARPTVHYFYQRKVQIGIEMMADQKKGFSPPLLAPKFLPTRAVVPRRRRSTGEKFREHHWSQIPTDAMVTSAAHW